jgi:periplasmic protein TonB
VAFEAFLEEAKPRPRGTRVLALIASALGHAVLVLGAAAFFLRPVVQAALPKLVPVSLHRPAPAKPIPPSPPVIPAPAMMAAAPEKPALARPARRRPPPARPQTAAPAAPAPSALPPAPVLEAAAATESAPPAIDLPAAPPAPASPAAPPAVQPARRPRFLPETLASSQKLSGQMPRLPAALARSGASYVVLARICVGDSGRVDSVTLERAAHPAIDDEVRSVLPTWRYRPLLVAGQAIPFCTFARFEFRAL